MSPGLLLAQLPLAPKWGGTAFLAQTSGWGQFVEIDVIPQLDSVYYLLGQCWETWSYSMLLAGDPLLS